jgi:hypothetical protein
LNQKIIDKINEVRKLQLEYKNLKQIARQEVEKTKVQLVLKLKEQGVIHIACNHETIKLLVELHDIADTRQGKELRCINCQTDVFFRYGANLSKDEWETVDRIYQDNTKVEEYKKRLYDMKEKQFKALRIEIANMVADSLRKAKLLDGCVHKAKGTHFEKCLVCGEYVEGIHDVLVNTNKSTQKELVKKTLSTLPIRYDERSWNTDIENCFKEGN